MGETKKAGGCGCSLASCLAGCLIGAIAAAGCTTLVGVAAWYYLPGYLESRFGTAVEPGPGEEPATVVEKTQPNPQALARLETKVNAFSAAMGSEGPVDVTLVLTEAELNAWIAENLLSERSPFPLANASVNLDEGRFLALATARGSDIAKYLPDGTGMSYMKGMLSRVNFVDVQVATRAEARDGKLALDIESVNVGGLPLPASVASSILEQATGGGNITIKGLSLSDLKIEGGRIMVRGTRATR